MEITKPQSKPFIVTTIYRPPNANAEFFDHLEKLIKQIDDENKEMYILGDLNCQPRSQGFSLFVIGKAGKGPGTGRSHDFQHPDIVGVINYNNNE